MPTNVQRQPELEARLRVEKDIGATYIFMGIGFATCGNSYTSFLPFEQYSRQRVETLQRQLDEVQLEFHLVYLDQERLRRAQAALDDLEYMGRRHLNGT